MDAPEAAGQVSCQQWSVRAHDRCWARSENEGEPIRAPIKRKRAYRAAHVEAIIAVNIWQVSGPLRARKDATRTAKFGFLLARSGLDPVVGGGGGGGGRHDSDNDNGGPI